VGLSGYFFDFSSVRSCKCCNTDGFTTQKGIWQQSFEDSSIPGMISEKKATCNRFDCVFLW